VSVALLNDFIYAMGGFDGHVRQNSVERYNPATNQWSLVQPMNHQRSDASATTSEGQYIQQARGKRYANFS
jgi:kelch-like protein 10